MHSNLVANGLTDRLFQLLSNSTCNVDSGQSSRLRADHLHILLAIKSSLQDELGDLRGLSTASVTGNNDHSAPVEFTDNFGPVLGNWEHLTRIFNRLVHVLPELCCPLLCHHLVWYIVVGVCELVSLLPLVLEATPIVTLIAIRSGSLVVIFVGFIVPIRR